MNITATNVLLVAKWYELCESMMCSPSTSKVVRLDFKLWGEVVPEASSWSRAAVSRININLKKAQRGKWDSLFIVSVPFDAHG